MLPLHRARLLLSIEGRLSSVIPCVDIDPLFEKQLRHLILSIQKITLGVVSTRTEKPQGIPHLEMRRLLLEHWI